MKVVPWARKYQKGDVHAILGLPFEATYFWDWPNAWELQNWWSLFLLSRCYSVLCPTFAAFSVIWPVNAMRRWSPQSVCIVATTSDYNTPFGPALVLPNTPHELLVHHHLHSKMYRRRTRTSVRRLYAVTRLVTVKNILKRVTALERRAAVRTGGSQKVRSFPLRLEVTIGSQKRHIFALLCTAYCPRPFYYPTNTHPPSSLKLVS